MLDYRVPAFGLTCAVTISSIVIYLNNMKNQVENAVETVEKVEQRLYDEQERYRWLESQFESRGQKIRYVEEQLKEIKSDCFKDKVGQ